MSAFGPSTGSSSSASSPPNAASGTSSSASGTNAGPSTTIALSTSPAPSSGAEGSTNLPLRPTAAAQSSPPPFSGFGAPSASMASLFGPATGDSNRSTSIFGAGPSTTTAPPARVTSGDLFGSRPPVRTTTGSGASSTRGLFGSRPTLAARASRATGGGSVFGNRPASTATVSGAADTSLFGSAPVQGVFGAPTTTASRSTSSNSIFGSTQAPRPSSSTGSTSTSGPGTVGGLFGPMSTPGTGTVTGGASSSANSQNPPTEASTTSEDTGNPVSSTSAPSQSDAIMAESTASGNSSGVTPAAMATSPSESDATGTKETEGSASPQRSVINIDIDGDLLLDIGGGEDSESTETQRFRVCSSTLRRHSPVWKQMFFGPWKESKPANAESEEWTVEFPDDNVEPMEVVLNIIHGRFKQVPRSLSLDELYKLLILTNKYDLTEVLRPWCVQWVSVAFGDQSSVDTLKSLFVAWELGHDGLFALRIEEISVNTRAKEKSQFTQLGTRFSINSDLPEFPGAETPDWIDLEVQDYLGPHDMLDVIHSVRKEVLSMITLAVERDVTLRRVPAFHKVCPGPRNPRRPAGFVETSANGMGSPALCDAAILGGIMIHLDPRLISSTNFPFIPDTIVQVASGLFPKIKLIECLPDHPACSLDIQYKTLKKKIHEDLPRIVAKHIKPAHREYMESQRNKIGIEVLSQVEGQKRKASKRRYW